MLALTVMILTQALGILLEQVLVRRHWLGPESEVVSFPKGINRVAVIRFGVMGKALWAARRTRMARMGRSGKTHA